MSTQGERDLGGTGGCDPAIAHPLGRRARFPSGAGDVPGSGRMPDGMFFRFNRTCCTSSFSLRLHQPLRFLNTTVTIDTTPSPGAGRAGISWCSPALTTAYFATPSTERSTYPGPTAASKHRLEPMLSTPAWNEVGFTVMRLVSYALLRQV